MKNALRIVGLLSLFPLLSLTQNVSACSLICQPCRVHCGNMNFARYYNLTPGECCSKIGDLCGTSGGNAQCDLVCSGGSVTTLTCQTPGDTTIDP